MEEIKQKKEEFKWGRFIGSCLIIIAFFSILSFTIIYIIFSKDKSNFIVLIIGFVLPTLMACGWVYMVSSADRQQKMLEFLKEGAKLVGDSKNQVASVSSGNITITGTPPVIPNSVIPGR